MGNDNKKEEPPSPPSKHKKGAAKSSSNLPNLPQEAQPTLGQEIEHLLDWGKGIIGLEEAKEALESSLFLRRRFPTFYGLKQQRATSSNFKPERCLLFWGPPGTGKTLLAHSLANAYGAKYLSFSPGDGSKWAHETEGKIKELFEAAKRAKTVLLIDEIDSFGSQRRDSDVHWVRTLTNQLLMSIEDFSANAHVDSVFIACTNMYSNLDPALLRRFNIHIFCGLPEVSEREQIITYYLSRYGLDYELSQKDIRAIAEKTEYFSGSDLEKLVRHVRFEPARQLQRTTHFMQIDDNPPTYRPSSPSTPGAIKMDLVSIPDDALERARSIQKEDFLTALQHIKPIMTKESYQAYLRLRKENEVEATNQISEGNPGSEATPAAKPATPYQQALDYIFSDQQEDKKTTWFMKENESFSRFAQALASVDELGVQLRTLIALPLLSFLLLLVIFEQLLFLLWIAFAIAAAFVAVTSYLVPLYYQVTTSSTVNTNQVEGVAYLLFLIVFTIWAQSHSRLPLVNVTNYWFIDLFPVSYMLFTLFCQCALYIQYAQLKHTYMRQKGSLPDDPIWGAVDKRLKRDGFQRVPVVGDGNCFFRALSHKIGKNHEKIRETIVQYIKEKDPQLLGLIKETEENWVDFIDKLGHDKGWAGEESIIAAARAFGVRIVIYHPGNNLLDYNRHADERVTIAYNGRDHYDAVAEVKKI